MASLSELKTDEELENWGIQDAIRQTEMRQNASKAAGKFEFITKVNRREVRPSTCNLRDYALAKYVMHLVSRPNTATYLLESVNYTSASADFRRFIWFIDEFPEPGKSELATLVFPIFVYFYLLLLESRRSGHIDAKLFFKQNKDIFEDDESYDDVLNQLCSFENWIDVKKDPYFKNFLECKFVAALSPEVLYNLREFIEIYAKEEGDKALLYVLHFHIHFQDNDEAEYIDFLIGESLTPILEGNEYESIELLGAKSVSEPINGELSTSLSKDVENEEAKLDAVSNSDLASNRFASLPKSCDSEHESSKVDDGKSVSDLAMFFKLLNLNHPKISTVVTKCRKTNIKSVDLNEDDTEIAYALGSNLIHVAPLLKEETQTKDLRTKAAVPPKRRTLREKAPSTKTFTLRKRTKLKYVKSPRKVKNSKPTRGSRRTKATKLKEDEISPQMRGMKKITLPDADNVYIVKYLPGKRHLLLAVCTTKVLLLDTETCRFEAVYDRNNGFILDIDVNSTSQYFATASIDLVASLYSFDLSTEIQNFFGHSDAVTTVRFHPNGTYLATGSDDCSVRLFDIQSGLCVRYFSDYKCGISTMAFSPDGKLLAAADTFGVVKVWDIKDGSAISTVKFGKVFEPLGKITTLCFQKGTNSVIIACNLKGECKLWDSRLHVRDHRNMQVLNFRNTPLKAKCCKNGVWKIAYQKSSI